MSANFCVFLHIRYMNPKVMGIAHDYLADNQPVKNPKGRLWMNSFHVSPDKGLGIHCFDTKENMENFLPLMKERIENFSTKFECKFTIETGILSPELTKIFEELI